MNHDITIPKKKHMGKALPLAPNLDTAISVKTCGYCGHQLWRHYRLTNRKITCFRC